MANQLLDVAPTDLITSARQNLINDMIDDGSLPINTSLLEIGGTTTIDANRSFSGNTLALIQTLTSGAALSISRNLASGSTNSPLLSVSNLNTSDDQNAVSIASSGSGSSIAITHNGTVGAVISIDNLGLAPYDIQADAWSIDVTGIATFDSLVIGIQEVISDSQN